MIGATLITLIAWSALLMFIIADIQNRIQELENNTMSKQQESEISLLEKLAKEMKLETLAIVSLIIQKEISERIMGK